MRWKTNEVKKPRQGSNVLTSEMPHNPTKVGGYSPSALRGFVGSVGAQDVTGRGSAEVPGDPAVVVELGGHSPEDARALRFRQSFGGGRHVGGETTQVADVQWLAVFRAVDVEVRD